MIDQLSAELMLEVAAAMGPDATVEDWVNIGMVCQAWRFYVATMFTVWLDAQHLGRPFGGFHGCPAEFSFLRRHVNGRCHLSTLGRLC